MDPILSSTVDFDAYLQHRVAAASRPPAPATTTSTRHPSASRGTTARPSSASATTRRSQVETSNQYFQANTNKYHLQHHTAQYVPSYQRPTSASTATSTGRAGSNSRPRPAAEEDTVEFVHSWKQYLRPASSSASVTAAALNNLVIDTDNSTSAPNTATRSAGPSVRVPTAGTSVTYNRNRNISAQDYDSLSRYSSIASSSQHHQQHIHDDYDDDVLDLDEVPKPNSPLRYKPLQHLDSRFPPSPQRHNSSNSNSSHGGGGGKVPSAKINLDFAPNTNTVPIPLPLPIRPSDAASSRNKCQIQQSLDADLDTGRPYLGVRFRVKFLERFFFAWKDVMKKNRIYFRDLIDVVNHTFVVVAMKRSTLKEWNSIYRSTKYYRIKLRRKAKRFLLRWHKRAHLHNRLYYRADSQCYLSMLRKGFRAFFGAKRQMQRKLMKKEQIIQAYRHCASRLIKKVFSAWKSLLKTSLIAKEIHAEHVERRNKIHSFMQRLDSASNPNPIHGNAIPAASNKPRAGSNPRGRTNTNPSVTARPAWTTLNGDKKTVPSRIKESAVKRNHEEDAKILASEDRSEAKDSRGEIIANDDFEVIEDPIEELTVIPPTNTKSSSLPTKDLPPPPSYRHFAHSPSGDGNNHPEAFAKDNNSKEMSNGQDQLSRKERLTKLRQQAMERIQMKKKEDEEMKRKERETKELRELEKIKEEAQKKQSAINAKTNPRIAAMNEELKRLIKKADEFRRRRLLVMYGLAPWNKYMNLMSEKNDQAIRFRYHHMLYRTWQQLVGYTVSMKTERYRREYRLSSIANTHYRRHLLRWTWRGWKLYRKALKAKAIAVTGMFSKYTLLKRSWQGWKIAFERSLREGIHKVRSVSRRGDRCTMRYYWKIWNDFMKDIRYEKEVNLRAELKWRNVQQWLTHK